MSERKIMIDYNFNGWKKKEVKDKKRRSIKEEEKKEREMKRRTKS